MALTSATPAATGTQYTLTGKLSREGWASADIALVLTTPVAWAPAASEVWDKTLCTGINPTDVKCLMKHPTDTAGAGTSVKYVRVADLGDGNIPDATVRAELRAKNWYVRISNFTAPTPPSIAYGRVEYVDADTGLPVLDKGSKGWTNPETDQAVAKVFLSADGKIYIMSGRSQCQFFDTSLNIAAYTTTEVNPGSCPAN